MDLKNPTQGVEPHGMPLQNTWRERLKFHSYKLDDRHTIDSHFDSLKRLASTCEFGAQTEHMIRDKILAEYNNANILKALDNEKDVSLEKVLNLIRGKENTSGPLEPPVSPLEQGALENSLTQVSVNSKDDIDVIVVSSLNCSSPLSLNEVETLLGSNYHSSLSQDDKHYIETIYTDTLVELWLDEASENVMGTSENPVEVFERLTNICNLNDCFCLGFGLPYNSLLKDLLINSDYIKTQEKMCILKFKSTFLSFLWLKSTYLQVEINFYQILVRTMKRSECVRELCNVLRVTDFLESVDEVTSFKKFLLNIINSNVLNSSTHQLKVSAEAIINQDKYFFVKSVKDTIKAYLEPVVLTETTLDGRKLLEVTGEHIVIGQVLKDIERAERFYELEEIRIVKAGAIHINENLNSTLWHGKNIVVLAETVIISKDRKITWDISGQNAENEEMNPADRGSDGAEGKPGESGGNVLLICDEIENSSNWKIITNGGKGGNGQDGGDGLDGHDGHYINQIDFIENFPPVCKFLDKSKQLNLEKTRKSVMKDIESVELFSLGTLHTLTRDNFDSIFEKCINDLDDIYFEAKTKTGCKILFSFYFKTKYFGFEFCQSFLLYKGSNGERGTDGGKGGIRGKGGFAGEVKIEVGENSVCSGGGIVIVACNGEDGKHGKSGMCGRPGISGLDRAYVDSTKPKIPFFNGVLFPKYFLADSLDCQRLKVEFHNEKSPESVYCPHNGQYAKITRVKKEFNQYCKTQNISTEKVLSESQYEVTALRKKTISSKNVIEQYEHKTSLLVCHNLNYIEEIITQIYNEIINEEMLHKEQVSKKTRVTRKVEFRDIVRYEVDLRPVSATEDKPTKIAFSVPTDTNWICLAQLNLQELRSFLNTAEFQALYRSKDESCKEVQFLFRSKYQLAILEHFDLKLNFSLVSHANIYPKCLGSVDRSLRISNKKEFSNEVESYLCNDSPEKRLSIIEKIKESVIDVHLCMKIFNLHLDDDNIEADSKFFTDCHLKAYKKHFLRFKNNKAKRMQTKFLPFLNILSETGNKELYKKLVKAITGQNVNLKVDVEHQIRGDFLLGKMYKKYIEQVNEPFVWKSSLMTEKLKEEFKNAITKKGPLSVLYREMLAHMFRTNILVYTKNERNQIVLVHNHNPSADQLFHILIKDNTVFKLETDERLNNMIQAHNEKGKMCKQIQEHVDSIKNQDMFIEECDQLISDQPFFPNSCSGLNKSAEIRVKVNHLLMEDENIQFIANSFEVEEEKQLVRSRLTMLKHEFIGYHRFLYYIALHMKTEKKQLLVKELCCIINFILKSVVDSSSKTNVVSWIIAAHHQTNWLVEFILFELEFHFKQLLEDGIKNIWREKLRETNRETRILFFEKLGNDLSLKNIENVDEVILSISQTVNYYAGLSQLRLNEWKYFFKDMFWINQMRSIGNWSEEMLRDASFYLVTLDNYVGKELCSKFIEIVKLQSKSIMSEKENLIILNTLKLLTSKEILFNDKLLEHLSRVEVSKWEELVEKECLSSGNERSLDQLRELIKRSSNTSTHILANLDEIAESVKKVNLLFGFLNSKMKEQAELESLISCLLNMFEGGTVPLFALVKSCERKLNVDDKMSQFFQEMRQVFMELDSNNRHSLETSNDFLQRNLDEIFLAIICVSVRKVSKKTLRNTQLLAIVTFLKTNNNVLGEISTGEGKSLIIISVAIMKALSGSKVDVITSSHVLAERDANASKNLCKLFSIEVGHNCSENIEERKSAYSKCDVVYGELSHFQRDYLLDRVYNNNIIGDRTCETILVDEVDSMLLDKANNVLYLSQDIPGLDKLEPLFVFIWKFLNLTSKANNCKEFFDVDQLKSKILFEMYGQIRKEDIRNLDTTLEEKSVSQMWAYLMNEKIIDSTGKVLHDHYDESKMGDIANNCNHGDHLKYLSRKFINREKEFEIPNYLKNFVETHLDKWIDSAVNAINLENNVDYVVDVDRSDASGDRNPNIIIVDRDTGTDLTNSQWDQGLHQFLQLKHGCRISPLTFKAVFISNVSYLKMYKTLFGLTGTLGSMQDRDLLSEVYEVEFVTIPTNKAKNFTEKNPILCNNPDDWSNQIVEEICKITCSRSALIICNSVSDVFTLKKKFEKKLPMRHIFTYTRDYEEFNVAEGLDVGHVIIATNLAGRGTDIKLSPSLIDAGGLHVCLSFFPSNSRIEEQAFGRASRNGQPGSGQMIFQISSQSYVSKFINLKKERDMNETCRVSDVRTYYETTIKHEEELFLEFRKKFQVLRDSKHCDEIKSVLLMTCLDKWAFWLEKGVNNRSSPSFNALIQSISKLSEDNFDSWSSQIQNPFQLIKLGLLFLKQKDYKKALQLFDRVIKNEPVFSEAAYYYRACARTAEKDIKTEDLIKELKIVEEKLISRMKCSLKSAYLIDYLKNRDRKRILQIDSFKEQQLIVSRTHEIFLASIRSIIGYPVTPEVFSRISIKIPSEFEGERIGSIVFNDLVEHEIIEQKIKDNITERDLCFISEYGICPKIVEKTLKSCKGSSLEIKELILKRLKKNAPLPSREMFWKELVFTRILVEEEEYAFVNHEKLNKIDPSLRDQLEEKKIDMNPLLKNRVSLYSPEELGMQEESFTRCHSLYVKQTLETMLGKTKFKSLKKENILLINKEASFSNSVMENVQLNYFDSITKEDFLNIGIPIATATSIIEDLIQEKVICMREESNLPRYALLVDCEDIDGVELKRHKGYTRDVKLLLLHCFAFRIALQKLQHVLPLCEGDYSRLEFPLRINLNKILWFDLQEQGIIENTLDIKKVKSKLRGMYSKSLKKENYVKMFSKIYNSEKSEEIVDELVKKKWLAKLKRSLMPGGDLLYCINCKLSKDRENFELGKPSKLSEVFNSDVKTIELILLYHLYISKNVKSIEVILKRLAGSIDEVGTPFLSLTFLENVLTEYRIPTSEIYKFTLNGFDQVSLIEEKKYTKRMKRNVLIITGLALTEIAVGVYLEFCFLGNPLGLYFISQGIDDLVFVTSCIFSGNFSWRNYLGSKCVSAVTGSLTCFRQLNSTFGWKSAGLSLQTMKEKCLGVLSSIKSAVGRSTANASSQVTKTEIITQLSKRVVVHAATGVAYGTTFALIDSVVASQVDNLGEYLTELLYSDIKNTIVKHSVLQSSEELYWKQGKVKTLEIIDNFLCKMTHRYDVELEETFDSIDLNYLKTIIQRTVSKGFRPKCSNLTDLGEIVLTTANVLAVLKSGWSYFQKISGHVTNILDDFQQELQNECSQLSEIREAQIIECSLLLDDFKYEVFCNVERCIKDVFSKHITFKVLQPLLSIVAGCLEKHSVKLISKISKSFLTDEEILKFSNNKELRKKSEVRIKLKPDFFSSEFNDISHEVLKTRKNQKVLCYLVKQNAPLDMYCLQLCCKIIPIALKQEGFSVPPLRIEVEKNGTKHDLIIGDVKDNTPIVHVSLDSDLNTNLNNNKVLAKDAFNFMCKTFLEHKPELKGLTASLLQELIVRAIDHYCDFKPSGSLDDEGNQSYELGRGWKCPSLFEVSQINKECENETPNQPLFFGRSWMCSPRTDVDIMEKSRLKNLNDVQKYVKKGFQIALRKINDHIHRIQSRLSSFNLILDDFSATKQQLAPPPPDNTTEHFHCYSVQYELIVPLMLKDCSRLVDFSILLKLKNKQSKNNLQPESPLGPCILYEINPVNNAQFLSKGMKGNIPLNIDCLNISYSVNDCNVAGELIVTSALRKHETSRESVISVVEDVIPKSVAVNKVSSEKNSEVGNDRTCKECDIIIIGDSLFKYIRDYIQLPKCHFEVLKYGNANQLKKKILSLINDFKGIKCVVLLLGNDLIKTNISHQKLSGCIFDVIEKVQENITGVKIIMCSLTNVKKPALKYCEKILNFNTTLEHYCTSKNLLLVDVNRIICPRDLRSDGFNLNRCGYDKLGKHLSEVYNVNVSKS